MILFQMPRSPNPPPPPPDLNGVLKPKGNPREPWAADPDLHADARARVLFVLFEGEKKKKAAAWKSSMVLERDPLHWGG